MKEKWEIVEHNWSDTSIYDDSGRLICTKSIDDEDTTEENQDERELEVQKDFKLIVCTPELLNEVNDSIIDLKILYSQIINIPNSDGMSELILKWIQRKELLINKAKGYEQH